MTNELYHHGILGMKWGIRRYQHEDGTLTPEGRKRYLKSNGDFDDKKTYTKKGQKIYDNYTKHLEKHADYALDEAALIEDKKIRAAWQKEIFNTVNDFSRRDEPNAFRKALYNRMYKEGNYSEKARKLQGRITSLLSDWDDDSYNKVLTTEKDEQYMREVNKLYDKLDKVRLRDIGFEVNKDNIEGMRNTIGRAYAGPRYSSW